MRRIVAAAVAGYVLFCALCPLSRLLPEGSALGELPDILMMTAYVWPYPLLLALQRLIHPDSWVSLAIADLAGLVVVAVCAICVARPLSPSARGSRFALPVAAVGWVIPLVLCEMAAVLAAVCLGWPIGE